MVAILQIETSRNSHLSMLFSKGIERGCHWGVGNEEAKWAEFRALVMKCSTIG